ncbi:hypothetical protein MMC16_005123 [Acarospora aff. strigata]|nr:hypothetical protein [Acarospora aff. strigata]
MGKQQLGRWLRSTASTLRCQRIQGRQKVFSRCVSTSSPRNAEDQPTDTTNAAVAPSLSSLLNPKTSPRSQPGRGASGEQHFPSMKNTLDVMTRYREKRVDANARSPGLSESESPNYGGRSLRASIMQPPHHLHVYATKHNTHITLTRPDCNPILSVAAGNINFRKGLRGSYDAAYQLAAYVLGRIQEQGLMSEIHSLEVVLRGFGAGREAVTKAILGSEGRSLRGRVTRVTDATRLKFGGTRSPRPRRLG